MELILLPVKTSQRWSAEHTMLWRSWSLPKNFQNQIFFCYTTSSITWRHWSPVTNYILTGQICTKNTKEALLAPGSADTSDIKFSKDADAESVCYLHGYTATFINLYCITPSYYLQCSSFWGTVTLTRLRCERTKFCCPAHRPSESNSSVFTMQARTLTIPWSGGVEDTDIDIRATGEG